MARVVSRCVQVMEMIRAIWATAAIAGIVLKLTDRLIGLIASG